MPGQGIFLKRKESSMRCLMLIELMPRRNLSSWTTMLFAYAQGGHLSGAKSIFDSMPCRDMVCWNAIFTAFSVQGCLEEARWLKKCQKGTLFPSTGCCACLHNQIGDLAKAKEIFDSMPDYDLVSRTALLVAYAQNGNLPSAREVFEEMPQRDIIAWNAMLLAVAQLGELPQARAFFSAMPFRDLVSWNTILIAYAERHELDSARFYFDCMPQRDSVSWNAMITAYAQAGHLLQSKTMFHNAPYHDLISWNAMLSAFSQHLQFYRAFQLFQLMPDRTMVSWNAMLSAFTSNGNHAKAVMFFQAMPTRDTVSWNIILGLVGKLDLLAAMVLEGSLPDEVTFTSILLNCSHKGRSRAAYYVLCTMISDYGLSVSRRQYGSIIDLLCRSVHLSAVQDFSSTMPFAPDSWDWVSLLRLTDKTHISLLVLSVASK